MGGDVEAGGCVLVPAEAAVSHHLRAFSTAGAQLYHTVQLSGQGGNPGQKPVPLRNPTWRGTEPCGKAEGPTQKLEQAQTPSHPSLIDLTSHYWASGTQGTRPF